MGIQVSVDRVPAAGTLVSRAVPGGIARVTTDGVFLLRLLARSPRFRAALSGQRPIAARISPSGNCAVIFYPLVNGVGFMVLRVGVAGNALATIFSDGIAHMRPDDVTRLPDDVVLDDGTVAYVPLHDTAVVVHRPGAPTQVIEIIEDEDRGDPDDDDHLRGGASTIGGDASHLFIVLAIEGNGRATGVAQTPGEEAILVVRATLQLDGSYATAVSRLRQPYGIGLVDTLGQMFALCPQHRALGVGWQTRNGVDGFGCLFRDNVCVLEIPPGDDPVFQLVPVPNADLVVVGRRSGVVQVYTEKGICIADTQMPPSGTITVAPDGILSGRALWPVSPADADRAALRTSLLCARRRRIRVPTELWMVINNMLTHSPFSR
jgi:hypothetical protein